MRGGRGRGGSRRSAGRARFWWRATGRRWRGPCLYLGEAALAALGAVAVHPAGAGLRLVAGRDPERRRPWSGPAVEGVAARVAGLAEP